MLLEIRFLEAFILLFVSSAASTPTQQEEDSRAASIVSTNGTTLPISRKSRVGGYFLVIADITPEVIDRVLADIDIINEILLILYLF